MIPFAPQRAPAGPTPGNLFNEVMDRIKAAFALAQGAADVALAIGNAAFAYVSGQLVFGGAGGKPAQSPNLSWDGSELVIERDGNGTVTCIKLANTGTGAGAPAIAFFHDGVQVGRLNGGGVIGNSNTSMNWIMDPVGSEQEFGIGAIGNPAFIGGATSLDVGVGSQSQLAAAATSGFLYVPAIATTPTGVPANALINFLNRVPLAIDVANLRLQIYVGGAWHYAQLI